MAQMRLENWSVVADPNPYLPPEVRQPVLHGKIYGSSTWDDGSGIVTSPILGVDQESAEVQTAHNLYSLGKVDPEWERLYPDAVRRFFNTWKDRPITRADSTVGKRADNLDNNS